MHIKCFFGLHEMVVVKSRIIDRKHALTSQRYNYVKCNRCNRIFNNEKYVC